MILIISLLNPCYFLSQGLCILYLLSVSDISFIDQVKFSKCFMYWVFNENYHLFITLVIVK